MSTNYDDGLFKGRGRIEYLGDPDDEPVWLVGNPPAMGVTDSDGRLMEYVYDPVTGQMMFLPKDR